MNKIFFSSIFWFLVFIGNSYCQRISITSPYPIGTSSHPSSVISPIKVNWKIDGDSTKPAVVQLYHFGNLIYPKENQHKESLPGIQFPVEVGNTYEIKLWVPRSSENESTWIFVQEKKRVK